MASFLSPLLREPTSGTHRLENVTSGVVVADRLLTAFDSATRNKGLLGMDALPAGAALFIAPSNAIHTFFMKFPIDVAFVTRDGRVVKIRSALGAWRIAFAFGAYAVVELPSGTLEKSRTKPGDMLTIRSM